MHRARTAGWVAVAVLFASCPARAVADQAVTFQIDPAHSGAQTDGGIAPPLHRLWARDFTGNVSYAVVANGRVFVTVAAEDPTTVNPRGTVYALDERTGATLWAQGVIGGAWSDPAYDDGVVFVEDTGGGLRAFRATDGAPLWSMQPSSGSASLAPPVAADGMAFVNTSADGATLYALHEGSGSVAWSTTAIQNNGFDSSPALDATRLYVDYACPNVFAFYRASGTTAWTWNDVCNGGGGTTPTVHNGRIWARDFGGTANNGYILDGASGKQVGSFVSGTPPAFGSDTVVLEHNRLVSGQDLASGTQLWRFSGDGQIDEAPIVVGRTAYVGSEGGQLYALDLRTGKVQWNDNAGMAFKSNGTSGPGFPTPGLAVADGILVAPASTRLLAYGGAPSPGSSGEPSPGTRAQVAGSCITHPRSAGTRHPRLRCRAQVRRLHSGRFHAKLVLGRTVYATGRGNAANGLLKARLTGRRRIAIGTYVLALRGRTTRVSLSVRVR